VTTDAHSIISTELDGAADDYAVDRRGELPWAVVFYSAIMLAVVLIAVRLFWPPEEHRRLTTDAATVTQAQ
jgi:hypothetical protein